MKPGWTILLLLAFAAPALAQSLDFQREVAQKRSVTLGDAVMLFHGLLNDPDPALTEEKAFAGLASKGIVPEDWKEGAKEDVSLGQISYMICKALDIGGGVMKNLTWNSRRYCYRECARLRLVKPAGPHSQVPGRDLIAIVGRLEDLLSQNK